jgi:hypothetical protein
VTIEGNFCAAPSDDGSSALAAAANRSILLLRLRRCIPDRSRSGMMKPYPAGRSASRLDTALPSRDGCRQDAGFHSHVGQRQATVPWRLPCPSGAVLGGLGAASMQRSDVPALWP